MQMGGSAENAVGAAQLLKFKANREDRSACRALCIRETSLYKKGGGLRGMRRRRFTCKASAQRVRMCSGGLPELGYSSPTLLRRAKKLRANPEATRRLRTRGQCRPAVVYKAH